MHEMQSCDTLGVHATLSVFRTHMLGKNSDRPVGEAQPLIWFPAEDHQPGETVDCSGFVIPQSSHTFGVLGFKPYWIWGFEMGANDQGVVIGNEAEFSRDFGKEPAEGLLGMDLLRLGLERGASARSALDVIVKLLETYGQNHNASALKDRRYENSFLTMDEKELWVLETAGRRWCAKRVSTFHALGNTYSIGGDCELSSPDLESHARENGWLLPYEPFSFEKAYSAPIPYFGLTTPRNRRVHKLAAETSMHSFSTMKRIFRDHHEGELTGPRWGETSGMFQSVCMHAMSLETSQTAASMLAAYKPGLGLTLRAAFSQPCCSLYLPAYVGVTPPALMSTGKGVFDENSLWWLFDRLAKTAAIDPERFTPRLHAEIARMEEDIETRTAEAEAQAAEQFAAGDADGARKTLFDLMDQCASPAAHFAIVQWQNIRDELRSLGVTSLTGSHADFLRAYCELTKMELL